MILNRHQAQRQFVAASDSSGIFFLSKQDGGRRPCRNHDSPARNQRSREAGAERVSGACVPGINRIDRTHLNALAGRNGITGGSGGGAGAAGSASGGGAADSASGAGAAVCEEAVGPGDAGLADEGWLVEGAGGEEGGGGGAPLL